MSHERWHIGDPVDDGVYETLHLYRRVCDLTVEDTRDEVRYPEWMERSPETGELP